MQCTICGNPEHQDADQQVERCPDKIERSGAYLSLRSLFWKEDYYDGQE